MHGIWGRTVQKVTEFDLGNVSTFAPDFVLLELTGCTNDLASLPPEVEDSHIEDLVQLLLSKYSVRLVICCQLTPRTTIKRHVHNNADFNENAALLNQYMRVVLEHLPRAICRKLKHVFPYQLYPPSNRMRYILMEGHSIYTVSQLPSSSLARATHFIIYV